jgi:hypothetical protein
MLKTINNNSRVAHFFMRESEALALLHEIASACKEPPLSDFLTVAGSPELAKSGQSYEILLKTKLSDQDRICLISVISKYNVVLGTRNGFTVIYSP